MPGVYDLLPAKRHFGVNGGYVKDMRNGGVKVLDHDETGMLVPNSGLEKRSSFWHDVLDNAQFNLDPARVYNILGCRADTLGEIRMYDGDSFAIGMTNGDGTVPLTSAFNRSQGYQTFFDLERDHVNLVQHGEPLVLIKRILKGDSTMLSSRISSALSDCMSSSVPRESILIRINSPHELNIYDASGRHTGPNTSSSVIDQKIPGSAYLVIGRNTFALLPAPSSSHPYRVMVHAVATGTLDMTTEFLSNGTTTRKTTYLSVPLPRADAKAELDLSFTTSTPAMLFVRGMTGSASTTPHAPTAVLNATTSRDIEPPILILPLLRDGAFLHSTTTLTFGAQDSLSGIAFLRATLNGVSVVPNETIILDREGSNIFRLEAIDRAGNFASREMMFEVASPPHPTSTPSGSRATCSVIR
jgi:hypothetical protein